MLSSRTVTDKSTISHATTADLAGPNRVTKMLSISTALSMKSRVRQMRQRKTEIARAVPRIKIVHDDKSKRHRYIIPWDSQFRRAWDFVAVCFVMYLSFKVPISVAFDDAWKFPKWFDKVMDAYFVTDILLNFRTGYVHCGHHITDPALIREHYMHRWFWVDVIATIPFETIFQGLMGSSARKSLKMLKWLKFPKLLRLSRFLRYLKSNIKYYQTFVLCIAGVFCIHVLGCMFVATVSQCTDPEYEYANGTTTSVTYCTKEEMTAYYASGIYASLLMLLNMLDGTQLTKIVQLSTNRTMSVVDLDGQVLGENQDTTAAEVETSQRRILAEEQTSPFAIISQPEWMLLNNEDISRAYMTVYLVCGFTAVIGFALIIQLIAEAVMFSQQRSQAFRNFYQKVAHVKLEMESHNLPEDLQYRVTRFYDYLWMNNRQGQGSNTSGILQDDDLSIPLKKSVALAMHGRLLRQVTIFDGCSENCIFDIAMRLRLHVYMPQDRIFSVGEVATELYLVREGSVKLLIPMTHARRSIIHEAQAMTRIQEDEDELGDSLSGQDEEDAAMETNALDETSTVLTEGPSVGKSKKDLDENTGSKKTTKDEDEILDPGQSVSFRHDNVPKGGVALHGDNLVKMMGAGTYFGELALLTAMPRACDAISHSMSELNELSKSDFDEVMTKFPELNEEIVEEVSEEYPHLREHISKYSLAAKAQELTRLSTEEFREATVEREYSSSSSGSGQGQVVSGVSSAELDAKLDAMEERIMKRMEALLSGTSDDQKLTQAD
ncbi:Potassium channel KAT1 [Hondaea fermentalgiana]|uniref:Potassium channel KAT1 n=1 Tax=Hondaea fermentalgiana TaxID=2315210 RepID=A0A2R5GFI2_9STRA|nr:Potassium channel KAT1 [Hondaea fermentalgiana]|eukprot:GBG29325.1 Potassium channel KAT1 [Hondaea fermentalgiana]